MWRVPEAPQGLAMGPVAVAGWGRWQWRAGSREKLRPARPLQRPTREIVRPASVKTPILGCFERAGRNFSHSHPPPDHAGRTFSRTGRTEVVTVKPTTPLQPLMQTSVKPPSPLLAPEQRPLKPPSPLQPKTTPKTPISHPQRRWRFQLGLSLREQRRHRFHARDFRCRWAAAGPGRATSGQPTLQTSSNQHDLNHLTRTPVTNVVNLSPKTSIFTEKADRLTTFVTTHSGATRNTSTTSQTTLGGPENPAAVPVGGGRARPGFETTHQARPQHTRPHWCAGRRRVRRARAGFEARRRTK